MRRARPIAHQFQRGHLAAATREPEAGARALAVFEVLLAGGRIDHYRGGSDRVGGGERGGRHRREAQRAARRGEKRGGAPAMGKEPGGTDRTSRVPDDQPAARRGAGAGGAARARPGTSHLAGHARKAVGFGVAAGDRAAELRSLRLSRATGDDGVGLRRAGVGVLLGGRHVSPGLRAGRPAIRELSGGGPLDRLHPRCDQCVAREGRRAAGFHRGTGFHRVDLFEYAGRHAILRGGDAARHRAALLRVLPAGLAAAGTPGDAAADLCADAGHRRVVLRAVDGDRRRLRGHHDRPVRGLRLLHLPAFAAAHRYRARTATPVL